MVVRRAGEYAFVRPGREMLYTVVAPEAKYKAKNFNDTVVYRGGDAVSAWVKAGIDAIAQHADGGHADRRRDRAGLGRGRRLAGAVAFAAHAGDPGSALCRRQDQRAARWLKATLPRISAPAMPMVTVSGSSRSHHAHATPNSGTR